jgi:hypothetical protein
VKWIVGKKIYFLLDSWVSCIVHILTVTTTATIIQSLNTGKYARFSFFKKVRVNVASPYTSKLQFIDFDYPSRCYDANLVCSTGLATYTDMEAEAMTN